MKNKFFILVLLLIFITNYKGICTNWFIDGVNGNDSYNGQTSGTAWKSMEAIEDNIASISPGDIIYIMSDLYEVDFYLNNKDGTNGNPIVVTSWGTERKGIYGSKVITGFTESSSDKWSATDAAIPSLNTKRELLSGIYVDNTWYRIAREPDEYNVWYSVDSDAGNTITDNSLSLATNAYAGGSLGGRYIEFGWRNARISSNTSNTVTTEESIGVGIGEEFVLLNASAALDQEGEWFSRTGSITIYSTGTLTSHVVQVPVMDSAISLIGCDYWKFENINIGRCNINSVSLQNCTSTTFDDVVIDNSGSTGIFVRGGNIIIDNSVIQKNHRAGIECSSAQFQITNTRFTENALHAWQMNDDFYRAGLATFINAYADDNSYIRYCEFDSCGLGIYTHSSFADIDYSYNLIHNYGYYTGDMGGIYSGGENSPEFKKRYRRNIIYDGKYDPSIGDTPKSFAHGIYLDYRNGNRSG
jgi:hypothetical protein